MVVLTAAREWGMLQIYVTACLLCVVAVSAAEEVEGTASLVFHEEVSPGLCCYSILPAVRLKAQPDASCCQSKGGRLAVLATRFPYINMVEVHGKVCTAVAISKTHILTKASCIGAAAGTNFDPGAWKGGPGSSWTPAQQVHIHPNWTGATYDEHDAAILTLGEPVRGQQVVLADPTFCLTQHLSAHTVWPWGAEGFLVSPQTAGADPRRCSTHGCVDATSGDQSAGTGELPGGILVLMEALSASTAAHGCGHTSHANIELGNPDLDLLVGIYALPDIASDSETAEEITWIPTIRPWIEDVIHSGQPPCLEGGHLDPPSPCSNG